MSLYLRAVTSCFRFSFTGNHHAPILISKLCTVCVFLPDMSVFQHCSVLFELKGLPFKDKKKIKLAVTDNGGNMAFVASKQCSLVVASGVSSLSPSRVRNIVKYQIPVVGVEYVHRCLEANCRLPVEDFKLGISLPVKNKGLVCYMLVFKEYTEMDHGLPKFPKNFQVAKYSVFQKVLKPCLILLLIYCGVFLQLLLEEKLNMGALSPEVGLFVELLWQEALGCINLTLITPVHKISLNDVTRAEGLLLQVQRKITDHKMEEALSLWSEYYTLLPTRFPVSPNMSEVSKQFDLCQLIRDILNVSEMTLGSAIPSSVGKYRALRCGIEAVPPDSLEFEAVTSLLQTSKIQVHQIYQVIRAPELQNFKTELGNIQPLLHSSSPHNFVGILSRGLLMPHVAVDQHGIQRTDAGNLGSGIYFTDNIKTTLKYSQCSSTDGSRLMLVCDVALGRCKDLLEKDLTLTQAPEDYDSVHGVQNKPGVQSEFTDDEYVVYSADQVKLKYVVRFICSLLNKVYSFLRQTLSILLFHEELLYLIIGPGTVEDGIGDIKNPLENVTAGLLNSSGQQIPLQAVHVKCKLMDLLAQVIIFQKYTNQSAVPIEAKYVFPLDDSAAVSGFEAFINGKHVVGQVKEKETARRQYKQAIEKGHGAYLMDQDAPDVFTISVGNLPPGATVLIKVTFVSELIVKDGSVFFSLPSSVAPWQETAALNQTTQVTLEKVCVTDEGANAREFNLDMSVEMPHEITEVKCTTHKVKMKKTDCKAVVSVLPGEVMGPEGFQLLVTLTEVHVPRMWVEKHPSKDSQVSVILTISTTTKTRAMQYFVLLLDASQSMKGESLNTARMLALQILNNLDQNVQLNVIFFGTGTCHFSSVGGSTELWRPLRALSLLPPSSGTRNLLLLSDGHIQSPELTLRLIRENSTHSRLFTCGLSPTANRHMLRALAQAGGGAYEFFDTKSKHTWLEKVTSQIKRMLAPGARSVSVKWQQFNPTAPPLVQAPKHLHALFNDCHTLVFGFVPHCTQATLLGNLGGEEIKTMVSTSELQKTKGTFLHKLTARAIIRDFEDGSLDSDAVLHEEKKAELKSFVIELSKEFSILSQFTSFVAIEERDSEEERGFTDIPKLIAEEDVDFLPYMCWAEEESTLVIVFKKNFFTSISCLKRLNNTFLFLVYFQEMEADDYLVSHWSSL
uniref:Poly [ADP-ribose] polymerase n=1 Tax=Periophthalmus magnuspinnatus TaxID=409849 RepID=A0A3B3ZVL4_9GOBI